MGRIELFCRFYKQNGASTTPSNKYFKQRVLITFCLFHGKRYSVLVVVEDCCTIIYVAFPQNIFHIVSQLTIYRSFNQRTVLHIIRDTFFHNNFTHDFNALSLTIYYMLEEAETHRKSV